MPKQLSGASLQWLAACLLLILLGIQIPAKHKVTKYNVVSFYALTSKTVM